MPFPFCANTGIDTIAAPATTAAPATSIHSFFIFPPYATEYIIIGMAIRNLAGSRRDGLPGGLGTGMLALRNLGYYCPEEQFWSRWLVRFPTPLSRKVSAFRTP